MTSFILYSFISTFISTFISSALVIWSIVSIWIIFKKAGRKWWEAIIPVWNVYVLFKIIWKTNRFWITLLWLPLIWIIWLVISLVFYLLWQQWGEWILTIMNLVNRVLGLASFIFMIITIILIIIALYRLSKKFGKSGWFTVWLIFLTYIFIWILAFDDAKFEGVEFNEKYSWKKWLLITLLISLIIGCCDVWITYKFFSFN